MNKTTTKVLLYASVIAALAVSVLSGMRGTSLDDVHHAVVATARVAFVYFIVVYFGRPLRQVVGIRWFLKHRRTLGLCVAIALMVHFGFLFAFFSLSAESVFDDRLRLYTGSVGVIALFAMAASSNDAAVRALGRRWKSIHRFGIHYLWFFFCASFLLAAQKQPDLFSVNGITLVVFVSALLAGQILRAVIWLRRRAPSPVAADAS